jgi:uncharacterized protein YdeI (YjbR/CyaY-like superfamily)
MLNLTPAFDAYHDQAAPFARPIFAHVRMLLHVTCPALVEDMKWSIPHFDYHGAMMCAFTAYAAHCSLSFFKEPLMADPRFQGNADLPAAKRFMGKITTLADLPSDADLIGFIQNAMALNEQGIKLPPRPAAAPKVIAMPDAFAAALAAHPAAKAVFDAGSDSYRKDYLVWINDAKTDATRQKRIGEAVGWIADGKRRFWKYDK